MVEEWFGWFPQVKHKIRVYDLNELAGYELEYANLYPVCDIHAGDIFCREDAFDDYIDWIANDPNGFVLELGDSLDAANRHSVGDVHTQSKPPQEAKFDIARKLERISKRVLVMVGGNHDKGRPGKEAGGDFAQDIAWKLGVYYEPEVALLKLKLGRYNSGGAINYTVMCTHGAGGGRTVGGKANALARMMQIAVVDLYVCGHTHQQMEFPSGIFVPDERHEFKDAEGVLWANADLVPRRCMMAGSFRDWGGYAARGLMTPNVVGMPRARLHGRKKWIKIED